MMRRARVVPLRVRYSSLFEEHLCDAARVAKVFEHRQAFLQSVLELASSPSMCVAYPRYRSERAMPSASSRSRQIDKDFWKVALARSTSFSKSAAAPRTMSAREIPTYFPVGGTTPGSPRLASPLARGSRARPRCVQVRGARRQPPASSLNARYRARLSFASVWDRASSPWNQASRAAPTSSLARAVAALRSSALQPRAGLAVVLAHVPEVRQGPCQPKSPPYRPRGRGSTSGQRANCRAL